MTAIILRDHERDASLIVRALKPRKGVTWGDLEWQDNPAGMGRIGRVPKDMLRVPFKVGDVLVGKETWARVPWTAYRMSEGVDQTRSPYDPDCAAIYKAGWCRSKPKWSSPVTMPAWASRWRRVVTDVAVKRVQDITEDEARRMGFKDGGCLHCGNSSYPEPCGCAYPEPMFRESLAYEWQDSWHANPWIVAAMTAPTDTGELR